MFSPLSLARPGVLGRVRAVVNALTRASAFLAVLCIVIMMLATIADVTSRILTSKPISGVYESGEVMMVAIVFLSLGYAESKRAHVSVTLLTARLPRKAASILTSVGLIIVLAVVVWMVLASFARAEMSIVNNEFRYGLVAIPIWPARIVVVVGLVGYLLELCFRLIDTVLGTDVVEDQLTYEVLAAEVGAENVVEADAAWATPNTTEGKN